TGAAATAATQREAALLAELQRACDAASRVWQVGGLDELDVWAADQRNWLLSCMTSGDEPWEVFPRTPLEQPLPGPRDPNELGPPSERYDLNATLEYFKRLAATPDPLTRAGALLASASYEQQLGHPLGAARILADAANLLRSTPGLARFAYRAELRRIDSLLMAGDHDRAREALSAFFEGVLNDHPARLGPREMERLRRQAGELGLVDDDPLTATLAELQRRAVRRQSVADVVADLLETGLAEPSPPTDELTFITGMTAADEPVVVAVRTIAEDTRLALVTPAAELLSRFWGSSSAEAAWRVTLRGGSEQEPLVELGALFAHAVLTPTPETAARLQAAQHRRWGILLATAAGTTGAWGLVIWMMVRVMARQRELARLQSRFVADVSHELKTPLALIRLLSETLAEQRVRDPKRIQSYHETITRESERLAALLDNILDLGRIESGRKVYEFSTCQVAEAARQAWALFEPQFTSEGFDARLEVDGALPTVRADAAALQQVLVNLLQNAYRYAGDGKFVRLSVSRDGHLIVIVVEDHGIGMNRGQLHRLGESFFRGDDTRVRQTRGTGLGLAIVNHIVTAHHGKIEVQSRPGEGSTFTVWIPSAPADDA
ncbi:MAG: HAMP domain-containing histidine kinase, partial [Phycisphaerae bacterium]|nr:HAMP domain-containing histidine kinase [Phycisphaerae bacterium]